MVLDIDLEKEILDLSEKLALPEGPPTSLKVGH